MHCLPYTVSICLYQLCTMHELKRFLMPYIKHSVCSYTVYTILYPKSWGGGTSLYCNFLWVFLYPVVTNNRSELSVATLILKSAFELFRYTFFRFTLNFRNCNTIQILKVLNRHLARAKCYGCKISGKQKS